eukprot:CAMPEP_0172606332 /NCGR_PEP_ID=MMETSP1068-20121228/26532_1 /TAXON_ID=35684 /ORGANISM="Pseudopedinella elastica, Strain CCMP716" /LENGTH=756 /DNA_ID=CAMNT_0013409007 /DNA_START=278 /DNA_END=2548 /DNA_ORIENTATION=+
MYLILHVVRFLMVFGFRGLAGLEHRHGYGVGTKEGLVMVYSGLRGAVGLALAMEVEHDHHISEGVQHTVLVQVGGIVLLTLLINGTTAGLVYEWLNPYPEGEYQEATTVRALVQLDIEVHGMDSKHLEAAAALTGIYWGAGTAAESSTGDDVNETKEDDDKKEGDITGLQKSGLLHQLAESPFHGYADWNAVVELLPDLTKLRRVGHALVLDRSDPMVGPRAATGVLDSLTKKSPDESMYKTPDRTNPTNVQEVGDDIEEGLSKSTSKKPDLAVWVHQESGSLVKKRVDKMNESEAQNPLSSDVLGAEESGAPKHSHTSLKALVHAAQFTQHLVRSQSGRALTELKALAEVQGDLRSEMTTLMKEMNEALDEEKADSLDGLMGLTSIKSSEDLSPEIGPDNLIEPEKIESPEPESPKKPEKPRGWIRTPPGSPSLKPLTVSIAEMPSISITGRETQLARGVTSEGQDIRDEVKQTIYTVVLKAMGMRTKAMYEGRSISGVAYQRLAEALDNAHDFVASAREDHTALEVEDETPSAAMAEAFAATKRLSPFQVAWNFLEEATDKDLKWAKRKAQNKKIVATMRALMPAMEEGLATSVQALMGFINAVEKVARSITSPDFTRVFTEDPDHLINHCLDNVFERDPRDLSAPQQQGTSPRIARAELGGDVDGAPLVAWLQKQLNVVKLQAYGTLAAMRLVFPAELKVIHTVLATDLALNFMRVRLNVLCEQGVITHHTLEDILEVLKARHDHVHLYRLQS